MKAEVKKSATMKPTSALLDLVFNESSSNSMDLLGFTPSFQREQQNDNRVLLFVSGIVILFISFILIALVVWKIKNSKRPKQDSNVDCEESYNTFESGRQESTCIVYPSRSKKLRFQKFFGFVDHNTGGEVKSSTSDVKIKFPPAAIPKGWGEQKVVVKVYLDADCQGLLSDSSKDCGNVQLSPIVECFVPGCKQFDKQVEVRIPHCAQIRNSDWTFTLKWSESEPGKPTVWNEVQLKSKSKDITFTYDETFVYIKTKHFTKFACIGCGNKKILNLFAVVFGNYKILDGIQQVNFRIYLCDGSKDTEQKLIDNEKGFNGRCRSQYKPVTCNNSKDWEVAIVLDKDWSWKLHETDKDVELVSMKMCFACCSRPPSVDFRCLSKDRNKLLTEVEAEFTVSQIRSRRKKVEKVHLITHDFRFEEQKILESSYSTEQLNENHLEVVVSKIEYQDCINLCRKLGLSNVDIDAIKKDNPCASTEQKYQLLRSWISKSGKTATLPLFIACCREENLNMLAEVLQKDFMSLTSNC